MAVPMAPLRRRGFPRWGWPGHGFPHDAARPLHPHWLPALHRGPVAETRRLGLAFDPDGAGMELWLCRACHRRGEEHQVSPGLDGSGLGDAVRILLGSLRLVPVAVRWPHGASTLHADGHLRHRGISSYLAGLPVNSLGEPCLAEAAEVRRRTGGRGSAALYRQCCRHRRGSGMGQGLRIAHCTHDTGLEWTLRDCQGLHGICRISFRLADLVQLLGAPGHALPSSRR
mmetsp:Transcript_55026/g.131534  ORF Transcript_55026/g.131534 Transcript_55026/m.131534 type:complete len:228 (-) Transcript_55026:69-752(-)